MNVRIISSHTVTPCKCGNKPTPGGKFWYQSKYSSDVIEGVIAELSGSSIVSTNGVVYPNHDISVKPLDIVRAEKLKKLGI